MLDIVNGQWIELTYPDNTLVQAISNLRRRHIQVVRIRDLMTDPLTPQEFLRRPLLRRSRYLLLGWDRRSRSFRQFYFGSTSEYKSPGVLHIGIWTHCSTRPEYHVAGPFLPTRRDRMQMAKIVARCAARELDPDLRLGIYADDLRLIQSHA